jgi:hypothetical protein
VQKGMVGEAAHTIAGDSNTSEGEVEVVAEESEPYVAAVSGQHAG